MYEYEILKYPDERLLLVSSEVEYQLFGTKELKNIVERMFLTMRKNSGIGLAATQVNIQKRIIVIAFDTYYYTMINPKILEISKEKHSLVEGCLSVPKTNGKVIRPHRIKVEFFDTDGNKQELIAEDLLSSCIQHEIDHLNGIIYINRLSEIRKYFTMKKIKKMSAI